MLGSQDVVIFTILYCHLCNSEARATLKPNQPKRFTSLQISFQTLLRKVKIP